MELTRGELVDLNGESIEASVVRGLLVDADGLDPRGLRVCNARIEGQLDLCDVDAKRPLVLRDCVAEEPVLFDRAHLPALDLTGLVAPAVSAPWLRVDHYLHLKNAQVDGGVNLAEAHVGSQLSLSGALLGGTEYSLRAPRLRTGSHVYLSGVRATGTVRLDGARIGGNLRCDGLCVEAKGRAFLGIDMQVEDGVFLHNGFRARSENGTAVRIRGSRIGGQLVLRDGRAVGPTALDVKHVRVTQEVFLSADFAEGPVELDGLTYTGLPRLSDLEDWLTLLGTRTPVFASQPYLQLAAAHQAAGHERDVRRIRIAQQRDLVRRGQLGRWGGLWHRITGATVGYGYRPATALLWLLGVLVLSLCVVLMSGAVRCSTVEQIGYALNAATPLVKVDAQQRCQVATATGAGQFVVATGWVLQLLAWAFATLFVAGFTGLVRKNP